jgi:hypothetical protein
VPRGMRPPPGPKRGTWATPVKVTQRKPRWPQWKYEEYMKSRAWALKRAECLSRWQGLCEHCGKAPATQAHHLTYERLGRELPSDLQPLCAPCHEEAHKHIAKVRQKKRNAAFNRSRFVRR